MKKIYTHLTCYPVNDCKVTNEMAVNSTLIVVFCRITL